MFTFRCWSELAAVKKNFTVFSVYGPGCKWTYKFPSVIHTTNRLPKGYIDDYLLQLELYEELHLTQTYLSNKVADAGISSIKTPTTKTGFSCKI